MSLSNYLINELHVAWATKNCTQDAKVLLTTMFFIEIFLSCKFIVPRSSDQYFFVTEEVPSHVHSAESTPLHKVFFIGKMQI